MGQFGLSSRWLKMTSDEKSRAILLLLDHLELWDREERLRGARAVLYLAQVGNVPNIVFSQTPDQPPSKSVIMIGLLGGVHV